MPFGPWLDLFRPGQRLAALLRFLVRQQPIHLEEGLVRLSVGLFEEQRRGFIYPLRSCEHRSSPAQLVQLRHRYPRTKGGKRVHDRKGRDLELSPHTRLVRDVDHLLGEAALNGHPALLPASEWKDGSSLDVLEQRRERRVDGERTQDDPHPTSHPFPCRRGRELVDAARREAERGRA